MIVRAMFNRMQDHFTNGTEPVNHGKLHSLKNGILDLSNTTWNYKIACNRLSFLAVGIRIRQHVFHKTYKQLQWKDPNNARGTYPKRMGKPWYITLEWADEQT
ncbi:hypothetical protein Tco_0800360 [Tanacetum coccineum]|uniref:Uncharacterized protein n=1 Tax=Tanacetum coccineum TaxID=301880 RepID=A0ABQ4ZTW9_9ASTR